MNFWTTLNRPFFALAPMEDVSDTVFRELVASTAAPGRLHVVFTEFLSVDGFLHDRGSEKVSHRLFVSPQERDMLKARRIKLVAQIWGSDPEKFFEAGRRIADQFEFDGIDINMGCPVKKIVKHNACSALIKTPHLAKEIVLAARGQSRLERGTQVRQAQGCQKSGYADPGQRRRVRLCRWPGKSCGLPGRRHHGRQGNILQPGIFCRSTGHEPRRKNSTPQKTHHPLRRNLGWEKELCHSEKVFQDLRPFLRKCHRTAHQAHGHQQLPGRFALIEIPLKPLCPVLCNMPRLL